MSILEIRDRLMPRFPAREEALAVPPVEPPVPPTLAPEPFFVTESNDRLLLTAPVSELASIDHLYLKLGGRFVEAEKANRNGAYWSTEDLELGLPTVAFGPLNWLHEERKVVGVLNDANMVTREAAAAGVGPHIWAGAVMWRWLYPQETRVVERASEERKLWYSMECISEEVECAGDTGCGKRIGYLDALRRTPEVACQHIRERSAVRRFVNPIFQGGAIIVPPVTPGWASADLAVQRQAAAFLEGSQTMSKDLTDEEATAMVQQVLDYARGA